MEDAIHHHPAETVAIYEQGKAVFEGILAHGAASGQSAAREFELATGYSPDRAVIVFRYLHTVAFMSAWYHVSGDKARRDTAAQSACFLVGMAAMSPVEAMQMLVTWEQGWRKMLRAQGIGRRGSIGCAVLVFLIISLVAAASAAIAFHLWAL